MFDPKILEDVMPDKLLDSHLRLRPLDVQDFKRNFLGLLSQLTVVGHLDDEDAFIRQFSRMKEAKTYYIIVIEDSTTNKVVAATTLFLEYKFIHSNGLRGRIEDVVVDDKYRGKKLGHIIVSVASHVAKKLGCYKLSLDCRDALIPFYSCIGFVKEEGRGNMLVQRFQDKPTNP